MIATGLFTALENASCAAYAVSVDQTIVFWNRAAERILGFTSDEVLGRHCYEVVKGDIQGALSPQCMQGCPSIRYLRAGLVPAASRMHLICSTGERKWVSITPMVVAGILKDAPLLVHLLEVDDETETSTTATNALREEIVAGGAEILSDRPSTPIAQPNASALTQREIDVLRLMALGWDTPRIAGELDISRHTVRNHIRNLRQKLGASTKLEAVVTGIRLGILSIGGPSP